jgi:hypothetical protein
VEDELSKSASQERENAAAKFIEQQAKELLGPHVRLQDEALHRVSRLAELADRINATDGVVLSILGKDAEYAAQDLLRAAVVLTHAHLEEFLRSIARVLRAKHSPSTYNSTSQIELVLTRLGFDSSKHNSEFPAIQEMIARRHEIVHRADRSKPPSTTNLTPIKTADVARWVLATQKFMESFYEPLFLRRWSRHEVAAQRAKA